MCPDILGAFAFIRVNASVRPSSVLSLLCACLSCGLVDGKGEPSVSRVMFESFPGIGATFMSPMMIGLRPVRTATVLP